MPLTYRNGDQWHVWLNPEPGHHAVRLDKPADEEKLPALCGEVHVHHRDNLTRISDVIERNPTVNGMTLEGWLTLPKTCTVCADLAREALGLVERAVTDVSGVGKHKGETLMEAGYSSAEDLRQASQNELSEVEGIGIALAARIKADVGNPPGRSL